MILTNLFYRMLYGKEIELKLDLLSFPHVNPLLLEELRILYRQGMTLSRFKGIFQLTKVNSETQSVSSIGPQGEDQWRKVISEEGDNIVPDPKTNLDRVISGVNQSEKVHESTKRVKISSQGQRGEQQQNRQRLGIFPQMHNMNQYHNVLSALYKQENS